MRDETRELLENQVVDGLSGLADLQAGSKERQSATTDVVKLIEKLNEVDRDNADYWDKQERREMDRKRNEATVKLEEEKQKLSPGRAALEVAKIAVPVVVPLVAYNVYQKRVIKFEETGKLVSTAARELHLPKFTK